MTKIALPLLAALLALPMTAQANSPHRPERAKTPPGHHAACPPGLAKKSPACIPPGQARKSGHDYVGHRLIGDYVIVTTPERYGLDPRHRYARQDGYLFRIDRDTMEVLTLIGAVSAILN